MGIDKTLRDPSVALILVALAMSPFTASAADLGGDAQKQLVGLCSALKLIDPEVAIRLSGGWHGRQEISGTSGSA